jgi:6-phosphogluconolactonase
MPADDGVIDVDDAAGIYARELGDLSFDICLLGVGPDGHIASVFPDHPSFEASLAGDADVIGVRDAPKPPPLRISLTHPVINRSTEVWFTVSGEDKADAVGWAVLDEKPVPAGRAHGADRTVWLLDTAAASRLPADLVQRVG